MCMNRKLIAVVVIGASFIGCKAPETSTTTVAQDPTVQQRVDQILASDEIIFAHDHLRDLDHIQGALSGHMTAMTIELTVDQMKWVDNLDLDCAHRTEVKTCCGGIQDNTCFANDTDERTWFDDARMELVNTLGMPQLNGQVSIVNTVDDIDAARAANKLGIIIGTEGALATGGSLANVDALYQLGWRKMQFRHAQFNAFASSGHLTTLGKQLQATLNRRGIVVDTMHLSAAELDDVLAIANAPLLVSHQWQRGLYLTTDDDYLLKQTYTGGGHGVIALNALGVYYIDFFEHTTTDDAGVQTVNTIPPECRLPDRRGYSHSPDPAPATIVNFLDRLNCLILLVGVDHVAIGPDFMPEGDKYPIGGGLRNQIPNLGADVGANPGSVPDLVTALVTDPAAYTDDDIKKILGGNLRDLSSASGIRHTTTMAARRISSCARMARRSRSASRRRRTAVKAICITARSTASTRRAISRSASSFRTSANTGSSAISQTTSSRVWRGPRWWCRGPTRPRRRTPTSASTARRRVTLLARRLLPAPAPARCPRGRSAARAISRPASSVCSSASRAGCGATTPSSRSSSRARPAARGSRTGAQT